MDCIECIADWGGDGSGVGVVWGWVCWLGGPVRAFKSNIAPYRN